MMAWKLLLCGRCLLLLFPAALSSSVMASCCTSGGGGGALGHRRGGVTSWTSFVLMLRSRVAFSRSVERRDVHRGDSVALHVAAVKDKMKGFAR